MRLGTRICQRRKVSAFTVNIFNDIFRIIKNTDHGRNLKSSAIDTNLVKLLTKRLARVGIIICSLKKASVVTYELFKWSLFYQFLVPDVLYGQPKVHKSGVSAFRPILSSVGYLLLSSSSYYLVPFLFVQFRFPVPLHLIRIFSTEILMK